MAEPGVATPEAVNLREGESSRALVRSNRLVPDESCWELKRIWFKASLEPGLKGPCSL